LTIDTFDREFIDGLCFLPPVFRPLTGLTQQPSHCHRNSDNVPNLANLKNKKMKNKPCDDTAGIYDKKDVMTSGKHHAMVS